MRGYSLPVAGPCIQRCTPGMTGTAIRQGILHRFPVAADHRCPGQRHHVLRQRMLPGLQPVEQNRTRQQDEHEVGNANRHGNRSALAQTKKSVARATRGSHWGTKETIQRQFHATGNSCYSESERGSATANSAGSSWPSLLASALSKPCSRPTMDCASSRFT